MESYELRMRLDSIRQDISLLKQSLDLIPEALVSILEENSKEELNEVKESERKSNTRIKTKE